MSSRLRTFVVGPAAERVATRLDGIPDLLVVESPPAAVVVDTTALVGGHPVAHREGPTVAVYEDPEAVAGILSTGIARCAPLDSDGAAIAATVRQLAAADYPRDSLLRQGIEGLQDVFFVFDGELSFVAWNSALTEVTGYTDEEVEQLVPTDFVADADVAAVARAIERAVETGRATVTVDLETKTGEHIPYEFIGTPIANAAGDVVAIAGTGRDISDRLERERRLEQQAEGLERLNRINEVIRDVVQGVVRADTRAAIERTVCDRLAADELYEFAWVGGYDMGRDVVEPREWAGGEGDYLLARPVGVRRGVTAETAARQNSMQVVQRIAANPEAEPWSEAALARGFASAIALPLSNRDTSYGVLCLYSPEPDAFDETEQAVLRELAATIGHAIAAAERRRALVTDTRLTVTVELDDPYPFLSGRTGGRLVETVGHDDGSVTAFYRVDAADRLPDGATVVRDTDDETVVRVRTPDHVATAFADHGGRVASAVATERGMRVRGTFPSSTDVRRVMATLRDRYDSVRLHSRQEQAAEESSETDVALTDRQREVLTTAYLSGYFERPRVQTGDEIAAKLGIATPTFHEHLRIATEKLVRTRLDQG